ncbi:sialate O-acetylesterase [Chitinophaga sp. GCM10012297]|uniref:Sialate O-acetylesterase n=1 Tax=Chitinophaga chungangae TaxID=2821488 RepID=A0ABS3YA28_9BACT|nr:sialate O-acetylesterase [Chitinophaga chungangae]MBO9151535.1 sialate O-acetylesterase [Chitinophaga chungangae]
MKLIRSFGRTLLIFTGLFLLTSFSKPEGPDPDFHLYLLVGQSNMSGRGVLTDEYRHLSQPNVLMLDKDGNWVEAAHPLHFDKPRIAGVGPGLSFGLEMANADPNVRIGLIPCAVGGTPIESWEPGAMDRATKKYPYDDATKRLKIAMKKGVIKGIIWLQGEANSKPGRSEGYLEKLEVLIGRFRETAGDKNLPVVAGELGRYRPAYSLINEQLAQLPGKVKNTAVASSEGFTHKGDNTHFDAASATGFGKRFAEKMLSLQQKKID